MFSKSSSGLFSQEVFQQEPHCEHRSPILPRFNCSGCLWTSPDLQLRSLLPLITVMVEMLALGTTTWKLSNFLTLTSSSRGSIRRGSSCVHASRSITLRFSATSSLVAFKSVAKACFPSTPKRATAVDKRTTGQVEARGDQELPVAQEYRDEGHKVARGTTAEPHLDDSNNAARCLKTSSSGPDERTRQMKHCADIKALLR